MSKSFARREAVNHNAEKYARGDAMTAEKDLDAIARVLRATVKADHVRVYTLAGEHEV